MPALAGALFGLDIGASSGVLASLLSPQLSGTDWGPSVTPLQAGLLVGMTLFGALAGSLATLVADDRVGRKTELFAAAACYGVGAALMCSSESLNWLLLGRGIYGLGIGFAMHAAPAYIAETAPASVRGLLVAAKEVAIVGGILAGLILSYGTAADVGGWRDTYAACVPLSCGLAAGMVFLPESPRWLLLSGRGEEACKSALLQTEGRTAAQDPAFIESKLDLIKNSLKASGDDVAAANGGAVKASGGVGALLGQRKYWRSLAVGCSLMFFQQFTGQPSVLYRAATILEDAGFQAGKGAASAAVLIGVFKLVTTLIAAAQVDKWGRRPLLAWGVGGMGVSLAALAVVSSTATGSAGGGPDGSSAIISVCALLIYVGSYQISFGPVAWLMVGELFPLRVRGAAIAIASLVNFGSNFIVSTFLPTTLDKLGTSGTYTLFTAVTALAWVSIYFTVPETKGKSLEQIEALMTGPQAGTVQK